MLPFPKDFFLGETREGFYVEPMMKCAWAAQLEVLAVIEQICDKYGLRYFADWGTLLGAVRHRGFIPWDDDMDICMFREDYDKFFAVAGKELPDGYQVLSLDATVEWRRLFSRIVNADSISYDEKRLRAFHGCPYSVGIDIFPLDELPEDSQEENQFMDYFTNLYFPAHIYNMVPSEVDDIIPDMEELYHIKIDRSKNVQNQLLKLAERLSKAYLGSGSSLISHLCFHASQKLYFRKEWYEDCVYLPFEQFELPAPVNYDAVLTTLYGDYMTPVRCESHDYPFYKKQQEIFKQSLITAITDGSMLH
ncbi:MAG: LicD family protein [Lachnospiraceae bacterium]|nr:LicD family protein [Lachnospiraceae bacterium]MCM1239638.1 LicD family protein [Lachnospiraceae bacterium]